MVHRGWFLTRLPVSALLCDFTLIAYLNHTVKWRRFVQRVILPIGDTMDYSRNKPVTKWPYPGKRNDPRLCSTLKQFSQLYPIHFSVRVILVRIVWPKYSFDWCCRARTEYHNCHTRPMSLAYKTMQIPTRWDWDDHAKPLNRIILWDNTHSLRADTNVTEKSSRDS